MYVTCGSLTLRIACFLSSLLKTARLLFARQAPTINSDTYIKKRNERNYNVPQIRGRGVKLHYISFIQAWGLAKNATYIMGPPIPVLIVKGVAML